MAYNRKLYLSEKAKEKSMKKTSFMSTSNRSMSPSIDKRSERLAKKYYTSQNLNGLKAHEDILIMKGNKMRQQREQKAKQAQSKVPEECSFKPHVVSKQFTDVKEDQHRWDKLYKQSYDKPKKKDKTSEEIEIERNRQEYTFQPQTNATYNTAPRYNIVKTPISPTRKKVFRPKKRSYIDESLAGK